MMIASTVELTEAKEGNPCAREGNPGARERLVGEPDRRILPPLTPPARTVLWTIAGLFLLCVALRLNGSSIAYLRLDHSKDLVLQDAPSGLLAGLPKMIRSDEWIIWTPAIVSQARQNPSFPKTNPSLGPAMTPLLMSIPARDYTMFLRPQLWGYFLLPLEYGFAWNWDAKIFGLLAAMFLLFWKLTAGRLGPSLFGALSVLFSPLVQWWLSSPSMLPEMMTYWALGVCAALHLLAGAASPAGNGAGIATDGRRQSAWRAVPSVLVLAVSLANVMLCCYPPFEIVLFHLGVFLVAGFIWQHRLVTLRGVLLGVAAFALAALLLLPWFLECYATLNIVAHTVYPGQRQCFGGGLALERLFSGFLGLALGELNTPPALFNVCEAASFYPLWPLPLALGFCAFAGVLCRRPAACWPWLRAHGLQVMLAVYILVLTAFALVPFPAWLCHATLLSRTLEVRGLAGIGLASTLLIVLGLASAPAARAPWKLALPVGLVWCIAVLTFLSWYQVLLREPPANTLFLTSGRLLGLEGAAIAFGFVYLLAPARWAQIVLLAPFILKTALINPVCVGLPELLRSPALNAVRAMVQQEPKAQWVFYDSPAGVEALKSTGAPVIGGVRVIPDPALIRQLDPRHEYADAYNRYAHLLFEGDSAGPNVTVGLVKNVYCIIEMTVPRLRERFPGVKFIATVHPSPEVAAAGFRLWRDWPEDHLWIYRLAEQTGAPAPASQPAVAPPL